MKMTLGTIDNPRKDEVILKPDEYYIIEPFIVHQCEAVTDIFIFGGIYSRVRRCD